ncbi:MAG: hypothetical protein WC897_04430 [Candidatus Gracilibacteria bacterium]
MATIQKVCKKCGNAFNIEDVDMEFYSKVSPVFNGIKYAVPSPNFCPECRWIRRASHRNFRKLYHRKSDFSGAQMISIYSSDKPFKVYSLPEWWSDRWNALQYGRDFDFNRPFFEQFQELYNAVPKSSVNVSNSENCTYTNQSYGSQNCYLVFGNIENQDSFYSHILWYSKNCFDMLYSYSCEKCYECVDCERCYECKLCTDSTSCSSSSYLSNCRNCRSCLGCVNLVNKEFYVLNTPYAKDEYEAILSSLKDPNVLLDFIQKFNQLRLGLPHVDCISHQCEEVSGNHLFNSHACFDSFDLLNSENCRFCLTGGNFKDCYDCMYNGAGQELSLEALSVIGYHNLFCKDVMGSSSNLLYSAGCSSVHNCFGCAGLHQKEQYCILNKQYSKEEYEKLVPQIIEHMQKTGEWGEFFPVDMSAFGYNESIAYDYYPYSKEDAVKNGFNWYDLPKEALECEYQGDYYKNDLPINEVPDSVINRILLCSVSGKAYKILPQELAFYKSMDIQIPNKCPDVRHMERMARRNPRKLWERKCGNCGKEIRSSYALDRPEIVYCNDCYLKTIY